MTIALLLSLLFPPTPRLIVLGDSIGVGVGASDAAHSYAAILAAAIDLPLDNRAFNGAVLATTPIPTDLREGDIVVWLAGYNDMRSGVDPHDWGDAMRRAIAAMRAQGATVYVGSCLSMTEEGYARGAPDWNHGSNTAVAAYRAALPQAVRIAYDSSNHAPDFTHPNDAGHRQIAGSFLAAMRRKVYLPL